jgi:hypothetical protein
MNKNFLLHGLMFLSIGAFAQYNVQTPQNNGQQFSPAPSPSYSVPLNPPQTTAIQQAPAVVVPQGVFVPPGVVYVAPVYPAPAIGYVWEYHPRFGWGWHHPERGWHRGWR